MIMKKTLKLFKDQALILGLLLLLSCGSKDSGMAVCVFDKASLMDSPSRKDGKWLSSIALGEKLEFLGNTKTETSDGKERTFLKVKMVDGKEGWVQSDFIAPKSVPAVAIEKIDLYSRPDLASITKKAFEPMDIFALGESKDDWIAIVGKRKNGKWIDKGWIKNKGYSDKESDVVASLYIKRAIANGKKATVISELKAIQENSELSGSAFESTISEMLAKLEGVKPVPDQGESYADQDEGESVDSVSAN